MHNSFQRSTGDPSRRLPTALPTAPVGVPVDQPLVVDKRPVEKRPVEKRPVDKPVGGEAGRQGRQSGKQADRQAGRLPERPSREVSYGEGGGDGISH